LCVYCRVGFDLEFDLVWTCVGLDALRLGGAPSRANPRPALCRLYRPVEIASPSIRSGSSSAMPRDGHGSDRAAQWTVARQRFHHACVRPHQGACNPGFEMEITRALRDRMGQQPVRHRFRPASQRLRTARCADPAREFIADTFRQNKTPDNGRWCPLCTIDRRSVFPRISCCRSSFSISSIISSWAQPVVAPTVCSDQRAVHDQIRIAPVSGGREMRIGPQRQTKCPMCAGPLIGLRHRPQRRHTG